MRYRAPLAYSTCPVFVSALRWTRLGTTLSLDAVPSSRDSIVMTSSSLYCSAASLPLLTSPLLLRPRMRFLDRPPVLHIHLRHAQVLTPQLRTALSTPSTSPSEIPLVPNIYSQSSELWLKPRIRIDSELDLNVKTPSLNVKTPDVFF